MFKKLLVSLLSLSVFVTSSFVQAGEIRSMQKFEMQYIRVSKIQGERYRFELCSTIRSESAEPACILIGRQSGYTLKSLMDAKSSLHWSAAGVAGLDVVILAALSGVNVIGFAIAGLVSIGSIGGGTILGYVGGAAIVDGVAVYVTFKKLNPLAKWDQAGNLGTAAQATQDDVTLLEEQVSAFAQTLDETLKTEIRD